MSESEATAAPQRIEANAECPKPEPVVSVVIPTYNNARFLPETIGSVQAQTLKQWEIIVVDDGSDDDTAQVMEPLQADVRVRYLPRPHLGVSAARNHGIESTRGEFIALLDSDDLWPVKEKLEIQAEFLQSRSDVGWIFGEERHVYVEPKPRTVEIRNAHLHPPQLKDPVAISLSMLELCSCRFTLPTSSVMVRRTCLAATGGFDTEMDTYEDLDLWIRLNREFPVAFVPRILVDRKKHSGSLSHSRYECSKNLQRISDRYSIHRELAAEWMRYHFELARRKAGQGRLFAACAALAGGLRNRCIYRQLPFPSPEKSGHSEALGAP